MKNQKTLGIIIGAVAAIAACVCMIIFLVPGDNKGESKADNPEAAYNTKGKCKFYECLNALTNESTPEEVEKVIGFKPKSEIDEEKKRFLDGFRIFVEGLGGCLTEMKNEAEFTFTFGDNCYTVKLVKHRAEKK